MVTRQIKQAHQNTIKMNKIYVVPNCCSGGHTKKTVDNVSRNNARPK